MKLKIYSTENQALLRQVIKDGMQKKGFLKKAPIDERKLFLKDAEITLNFASTHEWAEKNLKYLVRASKWRGIPKAIIKERPGLLLKPEIKNARKNIQQLKEALINYLGAK
jgi:hypothetical protein